MNPHLAVLFDGDFGDLGGVAAIGKSDGNPAKATWGHRFSPIALFRGELQHSFVARGLDEQVAAEFEGVFSGGGGQLIDEGLGDKSVLRRSDRAPEADGNAEVFVDVLNL